MGTGNLVFKEFRNLGYLDSLKDRKYKYKSRELTLEGLKESGVSGQTKAKKNLYNQLDPEIRQKIENDLGTKPTDNFSSIIDIHHLNGDHTVDIPCNKVLANHGTHSSLKKIAALENIDEKAKKYSQYDAQMYGNCLLVNGKIQEQSSNCVPYKGKDANFFKAVLLYIESKK